MAEARTIEIDFDVHKKIEMERQSFAEQPNEVLRRLLGLGPSENSREPEPQQTRGAWTGKGVMLPEGTQLRMEYRGEPHFGEIKGSAWVVNGERFKSPSGAAKGAARTKDGRHPSLDGWKYWQVKRPGDDQWVDLQKLWRAANAPMLNDA
jgi:hypothetical protein